MKLRHLWTGSKDPELDAALLILLIVAMLTFAIMAL